jgi:uncharacterized lipoprotein YehR (DUF1307 family)
MNYKLGKIVLNIEEEIEVALDSLDERYKSISKILQVPLYYDSPEIRQVLYDVEKTRIAILKIASSMGAAIDEDTAD